MMKYRALSSMQEVWKFLKKCYALTLAVKLDFLNVTWSLISEGIFFLTYLLKT